MKLSCRHLSLVGSLFLLSQTAVFANSQMHSELTESQQIMKSLEKLDSSLESLDSEIKLGHVRSCGTLLNKQIGRMEAYLDVSEKRTEEAISVMQSNQILRKLRAKIKARQVVRKLRNFDQKAHSVEVLAARCRSDSSISSGEKIDLITRFYHLKFRLEFLKVRLAVLTREFRR